jgi:hypothetical protein
MISIPRPRQETENIINYIFDLLNTMSGASNPTLAVCLYMILDIKRSHGISRQERKHDAPLHAIRAHLLAVQILELRSRRPRGVPALSKDIHLALRVVRKLLVAPRTFEMQPVDRCGRRTGREASVGFVIVVGVCVERWVPEYASVGVVFEESAWEIEARDGVVVDSASS